MAWERLKTDYKDAVWSGLRKFIPIDNGDGSYSVKDVTQYTVYDESFFGAYDANRINTAVNAIMAALENGTDLYEVFTEFFENQKVEFDKRANLDLDSFNIFLDNLQATANADVVQLKKDYTSEMTTFENNQEILFNQWFSSIIYEENNRSYEKHLYHEERIKRIPKSEAVQKVQTGGFGV